MHSSKTTFSILAILPLAIFLLLTACEEKITSKPSLPEQEKTKPFALDERGFLKTYHLEPVGTTPVEALKEFPAPFSAFRAKVIMKLKTPLPSLQEIFGEDPWVFDVEKEGGSMSGTLGNEALLFYGHGELEEGPEGKTITYAGSTFHTELNEPLRITFHGILSPLGELSGNFQGFVGDTPFAGSLLGGSIWFQQQAGNGNDCGKLLAERRYSRVSELQTHVDVIIKFYEKCVHVCFVKFRRNNQGALVRVYGQPVSIKLYRPAPLIIPEDTAVTKGGSRIAIYDLPVDEQPVTDNPNGPGDKKISGEIKVMYATGCKDMHMVQYVKNTLYRKRGANKVQIETTNWQQDGTQNVTDENPGQLDNEVFMDTPGLPSDFEFDAATLNQMGLQAGDELIIEWKLETFFVCDGTFLGFYSWGQELVFQIKAENGVLKAERQTPVKYKPEWKDADADSESPGQDAVEEAYSEGD